MRGNARSSDLEPGARRGGAANRQAGGVAMGGPQHTTTAHPGSNDHAPPPSSPSAFKLSKNIEHWSYDGS